MTPFKAKQAERIKKGLCMRCGTDLAKLGTERTLRKCRPCADLQDKTRKEWVKKRLSDNVCLDCSKPKETKKMLCNSCTEAKSIFYKNRNAKKVKDKVCFICRGTPLESFANKTIKFCYDCFFKQAANKTLKKTQGWEILKRKFEEQGGKCIYTGVDLILGENISADHIKPKSRYPELAKDANNIQWVLLEVNYMKRNLLHEEFIEIVRLITANHK